MREDLLSLQQKIGLIFKNDWLITQAFTHSSYVNEHRSSSQKDNERLEYLGDAVLELAISEFLFQRYANAPEGELTKLRASIVCEASLVRFAKKLDFGKYVLLGKGEELSGGRTRPALLADVFESFIGALYLDRGFSVVQKFLEKFVFPLIDITYLEGMQDYKTSLQEHVQQMNFGLIEYRVVEEIGPAHDKQFVSEVYLNQQFKGKGTGRSKKEAEQQAAARALENLKQSL